MKPVQVARRIQHRVGRRGAALLAFAFIDFVIGWSLTDGQNQAQAKLVPAYRVIADIASFTIWGWVWIAVGIVCAASAFTKKDVFGFTAAVGIKFVWAGGFFAASVLHGVPRAWLGGATWLVMGALVLIIAGWQEPRESRR